MIEGRSRDVAHRVVWLAVAVSTLRERVLVEIDEHGQLVVTRARADGRRSIRYA